HGSYPASEGMRKAGSPEPGSRPCHACFPCSRPVQARHELLNEGGLRLASGSIVERRGLARQADTSVGLVLRGHHLCLLGGHGFSASERTMLLDGRGALFVRSQVLVVVGVLDFV